jgi:hypothetical protein
MSLASSFQYRTSKTSRYFMVEVVLPGGSIKHVFRNIKSRTVLIQGAVDRVKWTLDSHGDKAEVLEHLEFTIPEAFSFMELQLVEKLEKGRILFSFPSL